MASVHLDPAGLKAELEGPNGHVARDLIRRGIRIESAAKINATGREYGDGTRGPRVQTGRGRASIAHALGSDALGLFVDVGTNVFYMGLLEQGKTRNGKKFPFLLPALAAGLD